MLQNIFYTAIHAETLEFCLGGRQTWTRSKIAGEVISAKAAIHVELAPLSTPVRNTMMYSGASGSGGLVLMELELGKKLLEVSTRELPLEWSSNCSYRS